MRSAARGAVLIGVAVVIGIVLLQVVDEGVPPGSGQTAATGTSNGGTTTTAKSDVRPPQQVRVLVLNGSGVSMAAATMANKLRGLGYAIAGTSNAPLQTGTVVACRAGFEKEAAVLAGGDVVGTGATIAAFPEPAPAGAENADCIVVVGR
jgi:hypothetical protein